MKIKFNPIRYLFYFVLFSFIGFLLEFTFNSIFPPSSTFNGGIHTLFGLNVPFSPIYGFGVIFLLFFKECIYGNNIKWYIEGFGNGLILIILELLTGFLFLQFGIRFWDYSDQFMNFMGLISLRMSLLWIFIGFIFTSIYIVITKIEKRAGWLKK